MKTIEKAEVVGNEILCIHALEIREDAVYRGIGVGAKNYDGWKRSYDFERLCDITGVSFGEGYVVIKYINCTYCYRFKDQMAINSFIGSLKGYFDIGLDLFMKMKEFELQSLLKK